MKVTRRGVLGLVAATPSMALAQGFPSQPVRLVVPFPPGGPADLIGRLVARGMTERIGRQVVVENRSGAGGLVGIEAVARATPDGHMIGLASSGVLTVQPHLTQQMAFDPTKDLVPVGLVLAVPQILAVHPSVPAHSVQELVALAKAQPGRLSYGSAGIGSSLHMAGELFKQRAGIDLVHVPYRGAAPAVTDALAGRIQILMADVPALLSHVRSAALRGLAVTSPRRLDLLADLPTMVEAGVPGMISETFYGLVAPTGTPADRVTALNAAMDAALRDPETRDALAAQGGSIVGGPPYALATAITEGSARWGEVVRAGNIRLE